MKKTQSRWLKNRVKNGRKKSWNFHNLTDDAWVSGPIRAPQKDIEENVFPKKRDWSPTLAFLYPLYLHFYELLITSNDFW